MQIKNQEKVCGGAYLKYMDLIKAMLFNDWEVHHISPKGFSNIEHKNLYHHSIADVRISPSFIPFSIQALIQMFKINIKNIIDVIIVYSPLECLLASVYKIFNTNTSVVLCFHGDSIAGVEIGFQDGIKKNIYKNLLKIIERRAVKTADRIIFVSEHDRKDIMERTKSDRFVKTRVIYNNINTPRVIAFSKAPAIDFGHKFKIGFVGNLYEEGKGIKYLIKAFYNVKKAVKDCLLIIVGAGPDEQKLKQLCSTLDLQNDVIFTGLVENPLQYMKGFDLLVLPSLHEAFGMVIVESIFVGTPVIASRVGGIPEVLKYDELLFEPADIQDLTEKILNLRNKEEYNKAVELCNDCKQKFIFDWDEVMIGVIKETISGLRKKTNI
ncbi:MAG: glycosyltransferase [Acidaminococcaceae bacterium]|nr:glycosyltransferase [Acidaminococcaceae bacterium]